MKFSDSLREYLYSRYRISFAKSGIDLVVDQLLLQLRGKSGFYVDIGSNHPRKQSNTYYFYLRGWSGICVDANPQWGRLYKAIRPRDKFLVNGVSGEFAEMPFYMLSQQYNTMSTFDLDFIRTRGLMECITDTIVVSCVPLVALLDQHFSSGGRIDFMSIDVEGHDLEVVRGNDWQKYRPTILVVETSDFSLCSEPNQIVEFMHNVGYEPVAYTRQNDTVGDLVFRSRS